MIKGALKNQHIRTGWTTIAKNISSKGLCLYQIREKGGIWKQRGGIVKYAVCDKQEQGECEGRKRTMKLKRRMELKTRVRFDCGYVYTYTWRFPFEVHHSIQREIMLFIGKPMGRSIMISNQANQA